MRSSVRIFSRFLWLLCFAGIALARPETELAQLLYLAETQPEIEAQAKQLALQNNLPISLQLSDGTFIEALGVKDGQPLYAVMRNLAHPAIGGEVLNFQEIRSRLDLSDARINYGASSTGAKKSARAPVAGDLLMVLESTNDQVMAFDPVTGDLVDIAFIPTPPAGVLSTPIQAQQTAWGTITISDQLTDVVQEFDTSGTFLGTLAPVGGANPAILDNIRGHAYHPGTGNLLVTVASGANQDAIAEFDPGGNYLGNFVGNAVGGIDGPWCIWFRSTPLDVLVTGDGHDSVLQYDTSGTFLSVLAPINNFPEQVVELSDKNIAVANFGGTQNGVVILSPTGTFLRTLTGVSGNRGVWELGNGNLMTTNGTGVHEIDYNTGTLIRTIVSGVGARFVSLYSPAACTPGFLGDVNGDDVVNSTDGLIMLSYDAGLPLPQPVLDRIAIGFGDVDENGSTNSTDALITLTWEAGLPVPFPVGDPVCLPAGPAPGKSSYREGTGSRRGETLEAYVALNPAGVNGSQTLSAAVMVDMGNSGEKLGSYTVTLQWNPALLQLLDYRGGDTAGFGDPVVNDSKAGQGQLTVAHAYPYGANGLVNLLNLQFKAMGNALPGGAISLEFRAMAAAETFTDLLPGLRISEGSTAAGVEDRPNGYALENFPNPFNPATEIRYRLAEAGAVQIVIYNLLGETVQTLVDETQPAGAYTLRWEGRNDRGQALPSGMYFLRMSAGNFLAERKLLLMK